VVDVAKAGQISINPAAAHVAVIFGPIQCDSPFALFKHYLAEIQALDRKNFSGPLLDWLGQLDVLLTPTPILGGLKDPFFKKTAIPIIDSGAWYKKGDKQKALKAVSKCEHDEWRLLIEGFLTGNSLTAGNKDERSSEVK
jgi:hypothetical protein